MMIVNPAAMGVPAAQADGTAISWTRIFIGNVFPLAQLGNTTVFAKAQNDPGYMATLAYTPTLPDFSASLRLADFQAAEDYVAGSFTPSLADLSGSLRFSDFSLGESYVAGSFTPSLANLAGSRSYADFSIPGAWAVYAAEAANPQTPRIFFDQTGAFG